jgi:hypothetical protein
MIRFAYVTSRTRRAWCSPPWGRAAAGPCQCVVAVHRIVKEQPARARPRGGGRRGWLAGQGRGHLVGAAARARRGRNGGEVAAGRSSQPSPP